jgi:hypothetical protein
MQGAVLRGLTIRNGEPSILFFDLKVVTKSFARVVSIHIFAFLWLRLIFVR